MNTNQPNKNGKALLLGVGSTILGLALIGVLVFSFGVGRGTPADAPEAQEAEAGRSGMERMDASGASMEGMEMGGTNGEANMDGMAMDGSVRLTGPEIETFGITFDRAQIRRLEKSIRAAGFVEFDETRMAYVAPKFGGWVEDLHVDFTGQPVRTGQPLLDVYSPELVTAQQELLLARRMVESVGGSRVENVAEGARELLGSARRRLEYWDISEGQIERLLETGEVRKTLTLHAPVSGIVMEKNVFDGEAFDPGRNLYMIADLSEVWVNAEIFESDVPFIREGMPAELTVAARPGETLTGTIEYVYPTLSEQTRSTQARIAVPNPGGELKPGMYATVRLSADLGERLAVPASAVLHTGERAVAFVDMGGGRLMPHELRLGARGRIHVQILEGLEPGDRVVTSAQFLLDSESNLAEVMQAMMAQMNMSDMEGMNTDMENMDMGGMEDMDRGDGANGGPMPGMDTSASPPSDLPGTSDGTGGR